MDPCRTPQRPRRALGETPAEPSERQVSSESLAAGCAPQMVTFRNFRSLVFRRFLEGPFGGFRVPSRPKLLQKTSLQKSFLEAINFVIITKTLCIQLKQTRERPQKYYNNNCFGEFFCNNFGQDGTGCTETLFL